MKKLFNQKGELNKFQFLKIVLIISFFVVGISKLFISQPSISNASTTSIAILITLIVIEAIIFAYSFYQELTNLIQSYIVKTIKTSYIINLVMDKTKELKVHWEEKLPLNISNIKFSVFRCWYFLVISYTN